MRKLVMISALALCTTMPANAVAGPLGTPDIAAETENSEALALAALMLNAETVDISLREGFEKEFRAALFADPASAPIFKDHPKLVDNLISTLKPVLRDFMVADLPNVQSQLASMLAGEMTNKQISVAVAYLNTPIGQEAFKSGVAAGAKLGADSAETDKLIDEIANNLTEKASPEDQALAATFVLSGAANKLGSLAPEIAKLSEQWGKKVSDDNSDVIIAKTTEVFTQYFAEE